MRTVFGLFQDYADAEAAVHDLIHQKFSPDELNVIAQEGPAKVGMRGPVEESHGDLADRLAGEGEFGLERLLVGRQPVVVPDAGKLLAAGDFATTLTHTASAPGAAQGGLRSALVGFSVPEQAAEAYRSGVQAGGLILIVRTADERAGEAAEVMRVRNASHVASYNR